MDKIIGYTAILRYSVLSYDYSKLLPCVDPLFTGTTQHTTMIRTQSNSGPVFCSKADIHPTKQSAKVAAKNSKSDKWRNFTFEIIPVYQSEIGINSSRLFFKS